MTLNLKQIIGLTTQNKSGELLGKIKDLEINSDSGQIEKYLIKKSALIKGLLVEDLIIDSSQVVEMNENLLVVDDGTVPISQGETAGAASL
ncbi:MAG: PRC-barrel domain-containing protein [Patescibacteria group bacterium]